MNISRSSAEEGSSREAHHDVDTGQMKRYQEVGLAWPEIILALGVRRPRELEEGREEVPQQSKNELLTDKCLRSWEW
jgi:hypothetical protein